MKRTIFISFFILFTFSAFGVNRRDSLNTILQNLSGPERIAPLNELAREYRHVFPEKTIKLSTEAADLAEKYNDSLGKAEALLNIGAAYTHASESDKSLIYLDSAIALCKVLDYKKGLSFGYRYIGVRYSHISEYEKGKEVTQKALDIAKEIGYLEGISICYSNLAIFNDTQGYYDIAVEYLKQAIETDRKLDDKAYLATHTLYLGNIYKNLSRYDEALDYYIEGFRTAKSMESESITSSLNYIANIYSSWGKYEEALIYYQRSLQISEKNGNEIEMAHSLNSIGEILMNKGDYEKSLSHLLRALDIYQDMQYDDYIASTFSMIAHAYTMMEQYDKALNYHKLVRIMHRESGNKMKLARAISDQAALLNKTGEYQKALELHRRTLEIFTEIRSYPAISTAYYNIGSTYKNLGEYTRSAEYFNRSLDLAQTGRVRSAVMEIHRELASVYELLGNDSQAYSALKNYSMIRDSLEKEMKQKDISELQFTYDLEMKEKEIEALSKEKESQVFLKNLLLWGIITFLILAMILYWLLQSKKKTNILLSEKNRALADANLKMKESEAKLINSNKMKDSYLSIINSDLNRARSYIASLLPDPIDKGDLKTMYRLAPSATIGGDSFGYHWIDKEHFAFYLLDVSGHGVGAALHSVAVLNMLRFENLPNTDYKDPQQVLKSLNRSFQMKQHNNIFFTIWYGVYNTNSRMLEYASAGHPPAFLFTNGNRPDNLRVKNYAIGGAKNFNFKSSSAKIPEEAEIYVFSDGVYEILQNDGRIWSMEEMLDFLEKARLNIANNSNGNPGALNEIELLYSHVRDIRGEDILDDDFTMLKISIN